MFALGKNKQTLLSSPIENMFLNKDKNSGSREETNDQLIAKRVEDKGMESGKIVLSLAERKIERKSMFLLC